MEVLKTFEQLATNTHYNPEIQNLIMNLPHKLTEAYIQNDAHRLRSLISGSFHFPDIRIVAKK